MYGLVQEFQRLRFVPLHSKTCILNGPIQHSLNVAMFFMF